MMARSSKAPSMGRIQKRKTNFLQIIIFALQRAAGPYIWARSGHSLFVQALNYAIACQHIRFVAGVAEKLNEYLARVLS
jgi:hypothetical protein